MDLLTYGLHTKYFLWLTHWVGIRRKVRLPSLSKYFQVQATSIHALWSSYHPLMIYSERALKIAFSVDINHSGYHDVSK